VSKDATISEDSRIPLKLVSTICIAIIALCGAWYSLNARLDRIESKLDAMMPRVEMAEWSVDLQQANPSLDVPRISLRIVEGSGMNKPNKKKVSP
jgi:hypothetical protein